MTTKPKTRNPSTSSGPVAPAVVVPVDRRRDRKLTDAVEKSGFLLIVTAFD